MLDFSNQNETGVRGASVRRQLGLVEVEILEECSDKQLMTNAPIKRLMCGVI